MHIQCTHYSYTIQCTLQPCTAMYSYLQPTFSAHCSQPSTLQLFYPVHTAAILSSAHCSYTIQCTLQLFYPVHTAAILSSELCSYSIQCTLQLYYPVHTAAILIQCTLQLYYPVNSAVILSSAHCSYTIQCTHSAATLSGSNTIQYIQCTFEPPQGKTIPLLAYLQNSQQTLMVDCSSPYDEEDWLVVAVQDVKEEMKKMNNYSMNC